MPLTWGADDPGETGGTDIPGVLVRARRRRVRRRHRCDMNPAAVSPYPGGFAAMAASRTAILWRCTEPGCAVCYSTIVDGRFTMGQVAGTFEPGMRGLPAGPVIIDEAARMPEESFGFTASGTVPGPGNSAPATAEGPAPLPRRGDDYSSGVWAARENEILDVIARIRSALDYTVSRYGTSGTTAARRAAAEAMKWETGRSLTAADLSLLEQLWEFIRARTDGLDVPWEPGSHP